MSKKKGRDRGLLTARNAKILERFVYWTEEQRLRSDDAIKILAEQEFFLSETTVERVLKEAYRSDEKRVQVVFHPPKPPKLTQGQKEMLKKGS